MLQKCPSKWAKTIGWYWEGHFTAFRKQIGQGVFSRIGKYDFKCSSKLQECFIYALIGIFEILFWNTLSNQQCESIFSTFRRMEKENFSFQSLQVRAVCIQNKITEWLRMHENRTDIISKALRLVLKLFC